jgi:hypothetical protein
MFRLRMPTKLTPLARSRAAAEAAKQLLNNVEELYSSRKTNRIRHLRLNREILYQQQD